VGIGSRSVAPIDQLLAVSSGIRRSGCFGTVTVRSTHSSIPVTSFPERRGSYSNSSSGYSGTGNCRSDTGPLKPISFRGNQCTFWYEVLVPSLLWFVYYLDRFRLNRLHHHECVIGCFFTTGEPNLTDTDNECAFRVDDLPPPYGFAIGHIWWWIRFEYLESWSHQWLAFWCRRKRQDCRTAIRHQGNNV